MNPDTQTGVPPGSVGAFIEALLNFVIIAFVVFLVVKIYNRFRTPTSRPDHPGDIALLREIRDELRGRAPERPRLSDPNRSG